MPRERLHRFEHDGKRFAIDPESCFCFECDAISWDVLEYYPEQTNNRMLRALGDRYPRKELEEVIGELEWLRSTRSILKTPTREELLKAYEVEQGVRRFTIRLSASETPQIRAKTRWFKRRDEAAPDVADTGVQAISLLLGRSGTQKNLCLELITPASGIEDTASAASLLERAFAMTRLAGKKLTACLTIEDVPLPGRPKGLEEHTISLQLEFTRPEGAGAAIEAFARAAEGNLAKLKKALEPAAEGATGIIVVRPNHPDFAGAVSALDEAGFTAITLDMDGAFVAHPELDPDAMRKGLEDTARYYAERLLKHHYFRVEPIASIFRRIYNGQPQPRTDPIGVNELAIGPDGAVYPSRRLIGVDAFRLGAMSAAAVDEDTLTAYTDVGSLTTAPCMSCWARNLCGGGCAAVHHALTGSHRQPHEPWCEAQRAWMASAVSAFQLLSASGVHFDRLYSNLGRQTAKPSLFTLARAAMKMTVGVRPIEEADAQMLNQWENWNDASYFLCNETGVMLATAYDREMEALHPQGIEQELVLLHRDGTPFGLLKLRPDRLPGNALGWLYMRKETDYASDTIRKGFRAILDEAGGQQAVRRVTVPVAPWEQGLAAFLEATGFTRQGAQREALYAHGRYHDVAVFTTDLQA